VRANTGRSDRPRQRFWWTVVGPVGAGLAAGAAACAFFTLVGVLALARASPPVQQGAPVLVVYLVHLLVGPAGFVAGLEGAHTRVLGTAARPGRPGATGLALLTAVIHAGMWTLVTHALVFRAPLAFLADAALLAACPAVAHLLWGDGPPREAETG